VLVKGASGSAEPARVSIVKLRDGESIRLVGEHRDAAEKLSRAA
jgi:hypothetical protein